MIEQNKSYAGAAYNALMEEETKESLVIMLLQQFDKTRDLREALEALARDDGFAYATDKEKLDARIRFARAALASGRDGRKT